MKLRPLKDRIRPHIPSFALAFYYFLQLRILIFWSRLLYGFNLLIIRLKDSHKDSHLQELNNKAEFMIEKILNKNWINFKYDLHPRDRRMSVLAKGLVCGMTTENVALLINEIVKTVAYNGVYLEVGTYVGYTLLSAALYNPFSRCIGIDNFSQWDSMHTNEKILHKNLRKFGYAKNLEFYNLDYKEGIKYLLSQKNNIQVNVYYYDGEHSYENQVEGLRVILPYLSEKCVILVDDINCENAEKANMEFLAEHKEFKSIFKIKTESSSSKTWGNGFEVIARGF